MGGKRGVSYFVGMNKGWETRWVGEGWVGWEVENGKRESRRLYNIITACR